MMERGREREKDRERPINHLPALYLQAQTLHLRHTCLLEIAVIEWLRQMTSKEKLFSPLHGVNTGFSLHTHVGEPVTHRRPGLGARGLCCSSLWCRWWTCCKNQRKLWFDLFAASFASPSQSWSAWASLRGTSRLYLRQRWAFIHGEKLVVSWCDHKVVVRYVLFSLYPQHKGIALDWPTKIYFEFFSDRQIHSTELL